MAQLRKFGVYHPKDGALNYDFKPENYEYEPIALVEAENLVRSFYRAQNGFNKEYALMGRRSTCVGDLITDETNVYMVFSNGYRKINPKSELFNTIMELDKALRKPLDDQILNELLDNCI